MEVMQHLKDDVAGNINSMESSLVVQQALLAVNGEMAREGYCESQKSPELNNGSIVEEEEKVVYNNGGEVHKTSVYLDDEDGETSKTSDIKSSAMIGNVAEIHSLVSTALKATKDAGNSSSTATMESEEIIELEFFDSRAIDKLHTHNAYCPNCKNPISKVVLRIKRETKVDRNKLNLLGCLSCFRIFLPSCITGESGQERPEKQQELDNKSDGKCFDLHWIFRQRPAGQKPDDDDHLSGTQSDSAPLLQGARDPAHETDDNASTSNDVKREPKYFDKPPRSSADSIFDLEAGISGGVVGGLMGASWKPEPEITEREKEKAKGEVKIGIDKSPNDAGTSSSEFPTIVPKPKLEERGSKSIEVVKSIVYGGLMESITSLSVVSSAAASGATTLNVITIGLANLIGGLFVIVHNVFDLYTNNSEEKYQEALGQRKHFILHAILALLSYLIFGLAPPVMYGFTFRESDDRDFKILAVAVASFVCVVLLAIGKAYARGANTFKEYFLTILQYVTAAAAASGVAYAVGELFEKLMDELGWFNSSPTDALLRPNLKSLNPNWASY